MDFYYVFVISISVRSTCARVFLRATGTAMSRVQVYKFLHASAGMARTLCAHTGVKFSYILSSGRILCTLGCRCKDLLYPTWCTVQSPMYPRVQMYLHELGFSVSWTAGARAIYTQGKGYWCRDLLQMY